jgi:hypothetical protein
LERMRGCRIGDHRAKELIHDAFAGLAPVMPLRLFPVVSGLYFRDDEQRERFPERTLWSLNNAFTEAVKKLRDAPRHDAGLRIGRHFGRLLHRGEPVVIDGIELTM